jgi:CheY-like chemotaxis protein
MQPSWKHRNPSGKPTILLADDDQNDTNLFERAVRDCGVDAEVLTFSTGNALLDFLAAQVERQDVQRTPIVIMLDLYMPDKSGFQILEEIKSSPVLRRIPVLAFTQSDADADASKVYDLGANAIIVKPVPFERLCTIIQAIDEFWFSVAQHSPQAGLKV